MENSILIASDHAGFTLKEDLKEFLYASHYKVIDLGTHSEESVDYPCYAHDMASRFDTESCIGILICGSGIGMSIASNRHAHIRAALCRSIEDANLSRRHNDANVLVLGARNTDKEKAIKILEKFLHTQFEGNRHVIRIEKINQGAL